MATSDKQAAVRERAGQSPGSHATPPNDVPPTAGGGQGGLVRVTVNLTPRSADSLDYVSKATGLSKTDVINRALQVYQVVEELLDRGGGSILVKHRDGEFERVYIV